MFGGGEKTNLLKVERRLFRSLSGHYSSTSDGQGSAGVPAPGNAQDPGKGPGTTTPWWRCCNPVQDSSKESAALDAEDEQWGGGSRSRSGRLGSFGGVFAPVTLSILGTIVFNRMGFILSNAGVLEALLMLGVAYLILSSTALSICAISTNGAIEGGGVYFMLSRTLGPEFGGAIGVLFYFAKVVSSALYVSGCVEGLVTCFGPRGVIVPNALPFNEDTIWPRFGYSTALNTFNLCVCLLGARSFGKASGILLVLVSVCIAVSLASFFRTGSYFRTFEHKDTWSPWCKEGLPTKGDNCTIVQNGSFTGLFETGGGGAQSPVDVRSLFMANLYSEYQQDCSQFGVDMGKEGFAGVFAVLFSGVTGVMAGANMSGELKDPGRDIYRGTLSAIAATLAVFLVQMFLTASTCDRGLLYNDCYYLASFSFWPPIVGIGAFLLTLSCSLSQLIGSSRVLEAVSKDVLFGPFLAFVTKGTLVGCLGQDSNPVAAVALSWAIVELVCLWGGVFNVIARMCSVLFLLAYFSVNLACLGLNLTSAPNFRPSFRFFSWHTCLVGMAGCGTMMFLVSATLASAAVLICLCLVLALNLFSPMAAKKSWGSISQALLFHQVRKYLLMLDPRKDHVKFWRPQILLLVKDPRTSCALIDFVNALKKGGLYVIGHVYVVRLDYQLDDDDDVDSGGDDDGGDPGDGDVAGDCDPRDPCAANYVSWLSLVDHLKVKAFVELTVAGTCREGFQHLARLSGIGAMKPNTVCLGFKESSRTTTGFPGGTSGEGTGTNTVVVDDFASPGSPWATEHLDKMFPARKLPHQRGAFEDHPMSAEEYVGVVKDVLRLGKNVCLCRNFQKLNKESLFKGWRQASTPESCDGATTSHRHQDQTGLDPEGPGRPPGGRLEGNDAIRMANLGDSTATLTKLYLDVWLMDFFSGSGTADITDNTSLFLLQLACIVKMVPKWKGLTIRVFIAVDGDSPPEASDGQDVDQDCKDGKAKANEDRLKRVLEMLRIRATAVAINWEPHPEAAAGGSAGGSSDQDQSARLKSACQVVRRRSQRTAVSFLYMPEPPRDRSLHGQFLDNLDKLTLNWPPTLIVRGVSPVTSTTL